MLTACTARDGNDSGSKPVITVSYAPQKWIVDQIAGDRFKVQTLLESGTDPETFEPSVSTMKALAGSRAYLMMGTDAFEKATAQRLKGSIESIMTVDCSAGIERIRDTHAGAGAAGDPHLWSSVRNAKVIADNITHALQRLDPANAALYARRNDSLRLHLDDLDRRIETRLGSLDTRTFVIQHPSLSYFARDYGLRQLPLETDGKEASPSQYADRLAEAQASGAKVIFAEKEHNPQQTRTIADRLGLRLVEISINTEDWERQLLEIADVLAAGQ